jgi:hypothetical protein
MKMDAMQKRRMWKVVNAHLLATIFVFFVGTAVPAGTWFGLSPKIFSILWREFWLTVLLMFQPQLSVTFLIHEHPPYIPTATQDSHLLAMIIFAAILISIPIWSLCFGWIYVKFTNWLNHFPVLGKKVF